MDEKQKILKDFKSVPDMMPIVPKGDNLEESLQALQNFDFETATEEQKKAFLSNFEALKYKKVAFTKPIIVIYNPNSGKKVDLVPIIEARFTAENI